ncbi:collagen alpha-1(I) chain-like [Leopardus geoffroyi]|uniref:collagen alpha-1(I) chain-like n=1 Tax=Leopardus geoffroyi TaxID=46844 RepID=UPI001E262012|nr:collagen alpha-1(I) chain-like [Leopardus geoffroyi]
MRGRGDAGTREHGGPGTWGPGTSGAQGRAQRPAGRATSGRRARTGAGPAGDVAAPPFRGRAGTRATGPDDGGADPETRGRLRPGCAPPCVPGPGEADPSRGPQPCAAGAREAWRRRRSREAEGRPGEHGARGWGGGRDSGPLPTPACTSVRERPEGRVPRGRPGPEGALLAGSPPLEAGPTGSTAKAPCPSVSSWRRGHRGHEPNRMRRLAQRVCGDEPRGHPAASLLLPYSWFRKRTRGQTLGVGPLEMLPVGSKGDRFST